FLSILFLALTIVLAIFGLVIAVVFEHYPSAIVPCILQIPIALWIGITIHRKGGNLLLPSLLALGVMLLSVAFGDVGFLGTLNAALADLPRLTWVIILLAYSYIASVLPVWTLLQPRDFINSLQLIFALALVVLGLFAAAFLGGAPVAADGIRPPLEISAPAFRLDPEGAPAIFPFLFITIACGAISGFHCLVSSGTSSKQLRCETDAQFVGYGSMLTEGFLATLVILACVAGIGLGIPGPSGALLLGEEAYLSRYATWASANAGLAAKVGAFVEGSANFLRALGIPAGFSIALMGVFVASFAATTLDTACRLQRYVIQELAGSLIGKNHADRAHPLGWLTNRHGATIFAVLLAGILAALPAKPGADLGTGGMILWPLFGATNQLLGGLAFLVITFWMWRRSLPIWFILLPAAFMLVLPGVAMLMKMFEAGGWLASAKWHLVAIGFATFGLQLWMIAEAILAWPKAKGVLEPSLPPLPEPTAEGGRSC
ncbi:MAG: carbon starvation CstA family protein, partial [Verrucomicrobiota bacterium]